MGDENKKLDSFWGLVKEAAIDLLRLFGSNVETRSLSPPPTANTV